MLKRLKSIGKFLSSMKFGILLLLVLALACALGSFIPQGHTLDWYLQNYTERQAALIYGLALDDVFHSVWFLVLAVILCCNLLLCNLLHLPGLLERWKQAGDPAKAPNAAACEAPNQAQPEQIFEKLHMPAPKGIEADGKRRLFSVKNRLGLWGAWVCHLGILLLVIGFTLGQTTTEEYTVYGVPGQTKPVGDTDYTLTIDDFGVEFSESGGVQQYTAQLTMRNTRTGEQQSDAAAVNAPGNLFGYRVYQNSTGTAAKLTVTMDGKLMQEEVVCVGDYTYVLQTPLMIYLDGYQEDYFEQRPGYAYSTYYMGQADQGGVQVDGDIALRYGSVEISFSEPQDYTLLQVKADHYAWLVLVGGVILLLGLFLAFYLPTRRVWAEQQPDGSWTVYGESRKGGALFAEQFREAAGLPDPRQTMSAPPEASGENNETESR